jgi:hypothetical protein
MTRLFSSTGIGIRSYLDELSPSGAPTPRREPAATASRSYRGDTPIGLIASLSLATPETLAADDEGAPGDTRPETVPLPLS